MALPNQGNWRSRLLSAFLGTCVVGCQGLFGNQGVPADPLFLSRKPVESKAETAAPVPLAFVEPALPTDPALALANASPDTKSTPVPPPVSVPGILTGRPTPNDGPDLNALPSLPERR